jgi:predicted permease
MTIWSRLRSWARATLRRSDLEGEMDAELRFHMEARAQDLMQRGVPREEALRRARMEFGGLERAKEECREARRVNFLDELEQDFRYGARKMRNSPGFSAVAMLTLALGIGATTAIFSIVNAVVFRPLPYKNSSQLVTFHTHTTMFPTFSLNLTWPAFEQIRTQASALEEVVACWQTDRTLTGTNQPAVLSTAGVSKQFFEELGAHAQLGRLFSDADQRSGNDYVAVISNTLWRTRFAQDPAVIGRQLILDKTPFSVIGVAAKGFAFPETAEVWVPVSVTPEIQRNPTFFAFEVIARLRTSTKMETLQGELATIAARLGRDMLREKPDLAGDYRLTVERLLESRVRDSRNSFLILLAAASLVLLISCANLTSLLLARGWQRHREMAMRTALGASHGRLQRQCLVESSLLALLGGCAGIGLALGGVQLFKLIAPEDTARLNEVAADWTILWFAVACSLVAGVASGLAPARRAARVSPNELLKQGGGLTRRSRLGKGLVVVEVALAFVLLIGATLLMQTFAHLIHQNPGFQTDHLLTFDLPQPPNLNAKDAEGKAASQIAHMKEILTQVKSVPGVADAVASDHGVLNGMMFSQAGLKLEGALADKAAISEGIVSRYLSPGYLRMLDIAILRGREFTEHDALGRQPVILVNETMARKYWGTVDVIGKRISASQDDKNAPVWSAIVGVVANVRDLSIHDEAEPEYFLPLFQSGVASHHLVVRTRMSPEALADTISRRIWAGFPDQPLTNISTVTRTIAKSVGDERMHTVLLGIFAALGLILALLGVYGVVSYSVARRTQEIGVRAALGASRTDLMRMVIREGLLPVACGTLIGVIGAFGAVRVISGELYGVKPSDPWTFGAVVILMMIVGLVACWVPARRAMRVDPMVALRYE